MEGEDPLSICYCGWGYNRPMIRCRRCKHWYHYDCVNVTRKILEDPERWYCFECIDYKPSSDVEEDYDFIADVKRRKEMNMNTRKGVKKMLQDRNFSASSVVSMSDEEIRRSICCIEQQLLIEDDSPLIHNSLSSANGKNSKYSLERKNRLTVLSNYPIQRSFFLDTERMGLHCSTFSVNSYISMKEHMFKNWRPLNQHDEKWMREIRAHILENQMLKNCIPIHADVRTFDWRRFSQVQRSLTSRLFDVVMMDPPWQLTSENPCRGVAIKYQQLDDECIASLPLSTIQENGLLFIWAINSKYTTAIHMIERWGYEFVCDIAWVKLTQRGYVAHGNGFYLQHTKETCFVAKKGRLDRVDEMLLSTIDDTILAKRTGQSQKPNEIYTIIESLVPNGYYLEIFGRLNNLRENWVTIGNEI